MLYNIPPPPPPPSSKALSNNFWVFYTIPETSNCGPLLFWLFPSSARLSALILISASWNFGERKMHIYKSGTINWLMFFEINKWHETRVINIVWYILADFEGPKMIYHILFVRYFWYCRYNKLDIDNTYTNFDTLNLALNDTSSW